MLSLEQVVVDPRETTAVVTPPRSLASTVEREKIIYLVRHAEAEHNALEHQAMLACGASDKNEQEKARKAILQNPSLRDSPLSTSGRLQARKSSQHLQELLRRSSQESKQFQPPQLVLVSPLRRALMTATELFYNNNDDGMGTRFVALEILREKRTGLACDERSSVAELQLQFPHVDFSDLLISRSPDPGEDNELVRKRTQAFLDEVLFDIEEHYVCIVSHKAWLRELPHTLKTSVDLHQLEVDFDVKEWSQTLYKNAEIRVAEFGWNRDQQLVSIVSRSVDNAISSIVTLLRKLGRKKMVLD